MKIDFKAPILDLGGKQVTNDDGSAALLGPLIEAALLRPAGPVGGEENLKRFLIAKKVHEGDEITVEEATTIKAASGAFFGPLAHGRIVEAIEAVESARAKPAKALKAA
jgi:hypothetical protein